MRARSAPPYASPGAAAHSARGCCVAAAPRMGPQRPPGAPVSPARSRRSPTHPPPPGRLPSLLLLLLPVGRGPAPQHPVETSATFSSFGPSHREAPLGTHRDGHSHSAGGDVADPQPSRSAGGGRTVRPLCTPAGHTYHVTQELRGRRGGCHTPAPPAPLATAATEQKRPASPPGPGSGPRPGRAWARLAPAPSCRPSGPPSSLRA